ncbi:hypothetical protein Pint_31208 [Pistacia integerrima]|uniref:Uncharacterized protein n=1 Tax=Pistacia integerrima TaxID=434235 RepID=A0ACC0XNB4_9ROSI|nr:hypothetical protein Pint_31208 [Pistacia integerrima]
MKVMELLIRHVKVNAKNFHGLTAMDIFYGQEYSPEREILGKILRRAGAKSAFCDASTTTFASYLRKPLSRVERWNNILGISGQDPTQSSREVLLVVATLIATSTFQAVLNPPLQLWQADTGLKNNQKPKNSWDEREVDEFGSPV